MISEVEELSTPRRNCPSLLVARCVTQAVAVEKPVAACVQDILESHAVCEANGVPLYCSFQRSVVERVEAPRSYCSSAHEC